MNIRALIAIMEEKNIHFVDRRYEKSGKIGKH